MVNACEFPENSSVHARSLRVQPCSATGLDTGLRRKNVSKQEPIESRSGFTRLVKELQLLMDWYILELHMGFHGRKQLCL